MPDFIDQTGAPIFLPATAQRIVSLVPSQTELLYHLDLEEQVVGITKFCVHPQHWFRHKTRVGGTKTIDIDRVRALQPDLIIANKEENDRTQVEVLAAQFPVWTSDICHLPAALQMIDAVGQLTGTSVKAAALIRDISNAFSRLSPPKQPLRAAYLIWQEPLMAAGGDTFIHDMMQRCGFQNIFGSAQRYPVVTMAGIAAQHCDVLLLSSEPFPFREKHTDYFRQQLPGVHIALADGEMFSWYGSRLLQAPAYFEGLLTSILQAMQ